MDLSIVLPTFNSKIMAEQNVRQLHNYVSRWSRFFEIIVVDDGSRAEERLEPKDLPSGVRLIQLDKNSGKGAAVRRGMLEATGDVRVFTDIDLPYDLAAIPYAQALIKDKGFPFISGERSHPNSQCSVLAPPFRKITSKLFSKCVTLLIIGGIYDSQCGFKAFSAPLAKALFPLLTIDGFSFDVEIFYLILKYRIVIKRIPVCLMAQEVSTIRLFKHAIPMACQIMSIPFKWYQGKYRSQAMLEFLDQPYWNLPAEDKRVQC